MRGTEGDDESLDDSLNRTLISATANRKIGAMPLEKHLMEVPDVARSARGVPMLDQLTLADPQDAGVVASTRAVLKHPFSPRPCGPRNRPRPAR